MPISLVFVLSEVQKKLENFQILFTFHAVIETQIQHSASQQKDVWSSNYSQETQNPTTCSEDTPTIRNSYILQTYPFKWPKPTHLKIMSFRAPICSLHVQLFEGVFLILRFVTSLRTTSGYMMVFTSLV